MITNDDRYVWLLANIPRVEVTAKQWNASIHKPLLNYLQNFIDEGITKEGEAWIKKQRELLQ
jgi:hypothetical protein